jgi:hypothetical protein
MWRFSGQNFVGISHLPNCPNHLIPDNAFTVKVLSEEDEALHSVIFYILLLGQNQISSASYSQTPETYILCAFITLFTVRSLKTNICTLFLQVSQLPLHMFRLQQAIFRGSKFYISSPSISSIPLKMACWSRNICTGNRLTCKNIVHM